MLDSAGALERGYRYEADATERALRDRCADNDIGLIGGVDQPARISSFPVPVVMARRAGLSAGTAEAAEIRGQPPFGPLSFGVFLSWPLPCFSR